MLIYQWTSPFPPYAYDSAGHLSEKVDPLNQKTEYEYDEAGRMAETRFYAAGDHTTPVKTVTYGYDRVGNMISYDDGVTSALYEFDGANRKIAETVDYGAFSLTNTFAYHKNGLRASYTGPDGVTYGYAYDANKQLTALEIPGKGTITWNEYLWTRPLTMALPGGTAKQFAYDSLQRTTGIDVIDPGQNTVLNYTYTHDKMGNIVTKDTEHGDYGYDYDDLYRLTGADSPVQDDEAFSYDNVGNRLTSADTAGEWAYNENNELTGHDDVTYDYDLNGNMIEKNAGGVVTKFFYNVEDRLERVEDGSGTVIAEYYYDPFGRRLWKDVVGTRTCFHYSDEGLVGEYDAAGNEIKTYGWRPGSTWSTDPLFMKIGGEYYYYHNDHLGTPQKMTSVSGAVVWSAKYSSFGEASIDAETVTNNLRYPGQYFDGETGFHYNWQRYYIPNIARYNKADPVVIKGGLNLYLYAKCNPIQYSDFTGLKCTRTTDWEPVTVLTDTAPSGTLLSSVVNTKWKLVRTWDVIPFAYGGENAALNCGCEWEAIGCTEVSEYLVPTLHKATFECDDGECKKWKEVRYKEIDELDTVENDVECLTEETKIILGVPSGPGCDCESRPPQ